MRRLIALSVLVLLPAMASANWCGLFRRPPPTTSSYYAPVPVEYPYFYPSIPGPAYPVPAEGAPPFPIEPVPVRPVPVMPLAPPEVAPPSTGPVLRPALTSPMPYAEERSTSASPKTTVFDVYANANARPAANPGRFVTRFWNLSPVTMMLRIDGRNLEVPSGQSRFVETAGEFMWQVEGRASVVSRVPVDAAGVTVTIRR